MIFQSLKTWEENPITTTLETLPIEEVLFPKITVCPPKNTYTNQNHDFLVVDKMRIDYDLTNENSTAYQLLERFVKHFQQKDFEKASREMNFFKIYNTGCLKKNVV